MGLLSNLLALQLQWHQVHEDSLATGLLANPFLFSNSDEELQQAANLCVQMLDSGGAAMSNADAAALLKMDVNLPTENKSINNVWRMDHLCSVLLPASHPFAKYIGHHLAGLKLKLKLKAYLPHSLASSK